MRCFKIVVVCLASIAAMPSARGAARESREREARKACLLGDVAKGTEILADLFIDTGDATHIYNQGRCYEQNGQNEPAVLRFREYLRKAKGLPAADVESVERKIKDLQKESAPPESAASAASAPGSAAVPSAAPSAAAGPSSDTLRLTQASPGAEAETRSPVYKTWWFWSGIGAVVTGAVVTAVLLSSSSSGPKSPPCEATGVVCVP
jgi:hypothetical protein